MQQTYGQRLAVARRVAGFRTQEALGDKVGVSAKTIRNYEAGRTVPDAAMQELLRRALGDFAPDGDPVENAVRGSALHEWRQDAVISEYKRHLHQQREETAG